MDDVGIDLYPSALSRACANNGDRGCGMATRTDIPVLRSTIACPECGYAVEEEMPTDACQWLLDCTSCGAVLKPRPGDCCVFCSHGTANCPPVQTGHACCG